MAIFEWTPKFVTGNREIDFQHQNLFNLANALILTNALYRTLNKPEMRLVVEILLAQLKKDAEDHFLDEEKLMRESRYEEISQHLAMHDTLRGQLASFQRKFKGGEVTLSEDMTKFLEEWFLSHILHADNKLCSFLNNR